ncbi:MAG: hypothetical protein AB1782_01275 [Cyanobacteriota bacterium]
MVKIGKGRIATNKNYKLKELIMVYIEQSQSPEELYSFANYEDPKILNDTRNMLLDYFENNKRMIVSISNNDLKLMIHEIMEQEYAILATHLSDLAKNNSEFLMNLRDARASKSLEKLRECYKQQHEMTKCGIKKGIYILKSEEIFEIIDILELR